MKRYCRFEYPSGKEKKNLLRNMYYCYFLVAKVHDGCRCGKVTGKTISRETFARKITYPTGMISNDESMFSFEETSKKNRTNSTRGNMELCDKIYLLG